MRSGKDATKNFGASPILEIDDSPGRRTYFRVRVSGIDGRPVTSARLRLHVPDMLGAAGSSGGRIHPISDCGWDELGLTWSTQPAIDGPELDVVGKVNGGETVDFDVTAAIAGDGVYCFALQTRSDNGVMYESREGTVPPDFLVW